jgi:hypothetical protein
MKAVEQAASEVRDARVREVLDDMKVVDSEGSGVPATALGSPTGRRLIGTSTTRGNRRM